MANFFPSLFGKPDFGNLDRNAWLETLMLRLGDPFRPINGKYEYTVPGDAIRGPIDGSLITGSIPGSAVWKNNAFGIRELNEFSESRLVADGDFITVSDRPGYLFIYSHDDAVGAVYELYGNSFGTLNASLFGGTITVWGFPGDAGKLGVGKKLGEDTWVLENLTGSDRTVNMCMMSLGPQVLS